MGSFPVTLNIDSEDTSQAGSISNNDTSSNVYAAGGGGGSTTINTSNNGELTPLETQSFKNLYELDPSSVDAESVDINELINTPTGVDTTSSTKPGMAYDTDTKFTNQNVNIETKINPKESVESAVEKITNPKFAKQTTNTEAAKPGMAYDTDTRFIKQEETTGSESYQGKPIDKSDVNLKRIAGDNAVDTTSSTKPGMAYDTDTKFTNQAANTETINQNENVSINNNSENASSTNTSTSTLISDPGKNTHDSLPAGVYGEVKTNSTFGGNSSTSTTTSTSISDPGRNTHESLPAGVYNTKNTNSTSAIGNAVSTINTKLKTTAENMAGPVTVTSTATGIGSVIPVINGRINAGLENIKIKTLPVTASGTDGVVNTGELYVNKNKVNEIIEKLEEIINTYIPAAEKVVETKVGDINATTEFYGNGSIDIYMKNVKQLSAETIKQPLIDLKNKIQEKIEQYQNSINMIEDYSNSDGEVKSGIDYTKDPRFIASGDSTDESTDDGGSTPSGGRGFYKVNNDPAPLPEQDTTPVAGSEPVADTTPVTTEPTPTTNPDTTPQKRQVETVTQPVVTPSTDPTITTSPKTTPTSPKTTPTSPEATPTVVLHPTQGGGNNGGGYTGGGYKANYNTGTKPVEVPTEVKLAGIDTDIIRKGNKYSKIPTSTATTTTTTTESKGNSVIPVLAGLSAAAAAGIGAKAYLDRKKNNDNEDDDEFKGEDWSTDSDVDITYTEPTNTQEETLDFDNYEVEQPEKYDARTHQELEDLQ